jgi:hypothetical protein
MSEGAVTSKQKIVGLARRIVAREIDPLEGCRLIVQFQGELSDGERRDPDFATLVGVESETDHFPTGAAREHWDPDALAEQDQQRAEYLQKNETFVLEACRGIIDKFL